MQKATRAYKQSMAQPMRNRGYVRINIGVINSNAQDNVGARSDKNNLTYYSDARKPFESYEVDKVYATLEQDFTRVDGSMYFLPEPDEEMEYYNNGIVTDDLLGDVYIDFDGNTGFDIKGLTIDFGDCYPSEFTVEYDGGTKHCYNDKRMFVTEDVFNGTSFFIIHPITMVNGQGRLRIYQFFCGINNSFDNSTVINCSIKDYVSSITETIPSQDVSITVDNQDLYYSVDNPESTLAYFEVGQEVKMSFGYDVHGDGNIEWMPPTTTYLKTWSANDVQAKFTATDRFDYLTGTFYKGLYRPQGMSLYGLAIEVLNDAGITDEREYYIDPYLKDVIVYNPIPVVKHSEALQLIANAGRCSLYQDRQARIHMKASFVPDMTVSVNNQTYYSHTEELLKDTPKKAYAIYSNDFSIVDGSIYFMPDDESELFEDTGYVSESIADENGDFEVQPEITINLEVGFVAYGFYIKFRNVAPEQFKMVTYYQGVEVEERTVQTDGLDHIIVDEIFDLFDKMVLTFTKGYPNARITVDNILVGNVTDYNLDWRYDLKATPTGTRQENIKSISVKRTMYTESTEETEDLVSEEMVIPYNEYEYDVTFSNTSYDLSVELEDSPGVSCEIIAQSNYFARLRFTGITQENQVVKFNVIGKEYVIREQFLTVPHYANGKEIEWNNPLVSTIQHAKDLEEWLASYYLGSVDYSYTWRGDPRTDANDLFYLDLKERDSILARAYEHNLQFSGAWSCTTKARRAVMSWQ